MEARLGLSRFNLLAFSKKIEKLGPFIIFSIFGIVLIGAIVFWLNLSKLLPSNISSSDLKSNPGEEITDPIKQFGIKIDKIGILAPVIENVNGAQKAVYNKALKGGVAHFKGTSLPGEGSNIFIFGHSSTILRRGPYATIFARLNELENGDEIIVYYKDKEYVYSVFEKKVVKKDDLSVLQPTQEEQLTLMTCWPVGTDAKRLIIKSKKQ